MYKELAQACLNTLTLPVVVLTLVFTYACTIKTTFTPLNLHSTDFTGGAYDVHSKYSYS